MGTSFTLASAPSGSKVRAALVCGPRKLTSIMHVIANGSVCQLCPRDVSTNFPLTLIQSYDVFSYLSPASSINCRQPLSDCGCAGFEMGMQVRDGLAESDSTATENHAAHDKLNAASFE